MRWRPALYGGLLVTLAAGGAVAAAPARATQVEQGWLVALTLTGLLAVVAALPAAPTRLDARWPWRGRHPLPEAWPEPMQQLLTLVELGMIGEFDLHHRLRPLLIETAAAELRLRRGIDLQAQPGQAAAVLGPGAWELLRPDRPPPPDRGTRGSGEQSVQQVLEALERL